MNDIHQKKNVASTNTTHIVEAGIAGAIAGGVAVAAAVLMSDKKAQTKVKNALIDAKEKVTEYIESVKSQPVVEQNTKKLEKAVQDTKKKIVEKNIGV